MVNCPNCGAAVKEEKAFCFNCGAPMKAAKPARETPFAGSGATVLEPPPRPATPQPVAPPAIAEVQAAGRAPDFVSSQPAQVAFPSQGAMPAARKRSPWKFGFVLLVLFLMFLVFALAILID